MLLSSATGEVVKAETELDTHEGSELTIVEEDDEGATHEEEEEEDEEDNGDASVPEFVGRAIEEEAPLK